MLDPFDFSLKIVESQGIVALVLLVMMWQNSKERSALLHKNCELNHFIMDMLRHKIDEDSPDYNVHPGHTRGYQNGGHMPGETIASEDTKIDSIASNEACKAFL